jgi:hypothetical protein
MNRTHKLPSARLDRHLSSVVVLAAAVTWLGGLEFVAAQTAAAPQAAAPQPKRAPATKAPTGASAKADAGSDGAASGAAPDAAARKRDPAEAQRLVEAGNKQLQAGRIEQAIQTFTAAIAGGNLPPPIMAKALHQRGAAYRAARKPAQAISDLTSALWLKGGLNDADRADATSQRSAAYREAGLPDQADDNGRGDGTAPTTRSTRSAARSGEPSIAVPSGPTTALTTDSSAPTTAQAPINNLFANLFGAPKSASASAPVAEPKPAPVRPARPEAATSGWASTVTAPAAAPTGGAPAGIATATTAAKTTPAPVVRPTPAATPTSAVAAAPSGRFHARIGTFRSEADAAAAGSRLRSQFAGVVGTRQPQVATLQFGGNTIYHVRLGPYATNADAAAACAQIRSGDLDCTPVDR